MRYIALLVFAFSLLHTATAQAHWLEANSDHFVIYGDEDEEKVRQFAERLERFHATMGHVFGADRSKPSPSNRVRIFAVANPAAVRRILGTKQRAIVGVYIPRAGGSVALIPRLKKASKYDLTGETVLYHEYAHHFMKAVLSARAYPRWFTEGFAEFFASARFNDDGTISVGAPPFYRAAELTYARAVPIRTLLSFDGGGASSGSGYDAFYGQSWVLFHYLQMEPGRKGQLVKYQLLLASGQKALEAAEGAFGDLNELERNMESYMRRRQLMVRVVNGKALTTGPISIRKLRASESAIMPTVIESKVGVSLEEAKALVPEARKVAAAYPNDAVVLAALAEAEFDAGNDEAALAAANGALAIDAKLIEAHIQKGYALARKAETAPELWKDVRAQFLTANTVENDHPIPLVQFYLSYLKSGATPTKNAIDGLEWAMVLAPQDPSLRWLVAQQMVTDQRLAEAVETLGPLAYSAHVNADTEKALALLKEVEAKLQSSSPESSSSQQESADSASGN
jgi:tetratricopeptide (TPR) repeat protein